MEAISFGAAFLAGAASFVSPCVLPMLPTFLLILAGSSGAAAGAGGAAASPAPAGRTLFRNVSAFLLGFAVVFLALGATATVLGQFLMGHLAILEKAGAILLALLGLFLSGIIHPRFLYGEWRPFLHRPSGGAAGSFLLGMSFTVGWTPCTGPILAAIFIYAGSRATVVEGLWLLGFYVLGFALPFFALALLWRADALSLSAPRAESRRRRARRARRHDVLRLDNALFGLAVRLRTVLFMIGGR